MYQGADWRRICEGIFHQDLDLVGRTHIGVQYDGVTSLTLELHYQLYILLASEVTLPMLTTGLASIDAILRTKD